MSIDRADKPWIGDRRLTEQAQADDCSPHTRCHQVERWCMARRMEEGVPPDESAPEPEQAGRLLQVEPEPETGNGGRGTRGFMSTTSLLRDSASRMMSEASRSPEMDITSAVRLSASGMPRSSSLTREMSLPKESWVPDDSVSACQGSGCCKPFNALRGKHHCRCCGRIFCSGCSGKKFGFAQVRPPPQCSSPPSANRHRRAGTRPYRN